MKFTCSVARKKVWTWVAVALLGGLGALGYQFFLGGSRTAGGHATLPISASQSLPSLPRAHMGMSEVEWAAFDKAWCAAMRANPPTLEIYDGSVAGYSVPLSLLEGSGALEPLAERIGRRLLAQGDRRSHAIAQRWLVMAGVLDRNSFMQQALASRDSLWMDLALAHQVAWGGDEEDRRVAQAWRESDPGNALALMAAQPVAPLPEDEWLRRLAAATHLRHPWMIALNAAIEGQGVARHAATDLLPLALKLQWMTEKEPPDVAHLLDACKGEQRDPDRDRLCGAVADRLWALADDEDRMAWAATEIGRLQQNSALWAVRAAHLESAIAPMTPADFRAALADRLSCRSAQTFERRLIPREGALRAMKARADSQTPTSAPPTGQQN